MPLTITNALVRGPGIKGVGIRADNLKLRNRVVNSSGTGIKVLYQARMDLGTVSDPGNSTIAGGNLTGVAFDNNGFDHRHHRCRGQYSERQHSGCGCERALHHSPHDRRW